MFKNVLFLLCGNLAVIAQTQWIQKTNVPDNLGSAVGFAIGNYGYIGLGWNPAAVKNFYKYDPNANTWTFVGVFPGTNTGYAKGFTINNKGYVAVGQSTTAVSEVWEYDPGSNTWTQKASFGAGVRTGAACFVIGNKAYVGSGSGPTLSYNNDLYEFDPVANTWTQRANTPGARGWGRVGFSIGSKGYLCTGKDSLNSTKAFYEYNPVTDVWTQKANFPGIGRVNSTAFSLNGKGYVGCGIDPITNTNALTDFYEYDPAMNTWTAISSLTPTPRQTGVGMVINGAAYVGTGGNTGAPYYNDFWKLSVGGSTVIGVPETEIDECAGSFLNDSFLQGAGACRFQSLEVFDLSGKKIVNQPNGEMPIGDLLKKLDTGIYMVRILTMNNTVVIRKVSLENPY